MNAEEVTFTAPGTGTVPQSIPDWLSQQSINAFDYMTEEPRTDVLLRGETVDVRLALKAGTDYALSVNNGGSDYTSAPTVTITGGGGSAGAGTAVLSTSIDMGSTALTAFKLKYNFKRYGSVAYDPPSLAAGAMTTATVTLTGAALGDFAVCSFSLDLAGVVTIPYVSAANTVTVIFWNLSGGVLDLGSGTLRAGVYSTTT